MSDEQKQKFSHAQAEGAEWDPGLREYFDYRDLGIRAATHGGVVAHVLRAKQGHSATGQWHRHRCDFQLFYVLNGWARFEYEGEGERVVRKGDCVLQPAGIRHREIEHSEDLEILEVVAPADFVTEAAE